MRVPVRVVAGADGDVVGRAADDVGDDLRRGRLVPLPLRRRPERDDDLAEDVQLDVATSLFPENWSSGLISCDCPKLFVPESSVEPMPTPSSFPRDSASRRRSSIQS